MNTFDDHQSTLWTSSEEDPQSQIVGSYNRNTCEASRRIKIGPHWFYVLDTIVHCLSVHDDCLRQIHRDNLEAYYFLGLQPEVPCIFIWASSAI